MKQLTSNFENNDLMTVAELAEFLRVGRTTAYKLVKEGTIPSVRFGKQIRILKRDILAVAKQQKLEISLLICYTVLGTDQHLGKA